MSLPEFDDASPNSRLKFGAFLQRFAYFRPKFRMNENKNNINIIGLTGLAFNRMHNRMNLNITCMIISTIFL